MTSNSNENDYVSLVRIPRKWFNLFIWIFSTVIVVNTLVELLTNWAWKSLGATALERMAVLMTLTVGWFFILSHVWEVIMLGYARIFKDRVYAEGKAEGKAEGEAKHHRRVSEWNRRRIQAEKEGKEFTEPLPEPESQNNIKSSEN